MVGFGLWHTVCLPIDFLTKFIKKGGDNGDNHVADAALHYGPYCCLL